MEIDILAIDKKIKNFLLKEEKKIPLFKTQIDIIDRKIQMKIPYGDKQLLLIDKDKLENKIAKLDNNVLYSEYICATQKILDEYIKIINTPVVTSFSGKKTETSTNKSHLITQYMDIASNYIKLKKPIEKLVLEKKCTTCNIIAKTNICENCGTEMPVYVDTSYKDTDRINNNQRYKYSRQSNFAEIIKQFQGENNKTIPDKLFRDLEKTWQDNYIVVPDKDIMIKLKNKGYTTSKPAPEIMTRHIKYMNVTKEIIKSALLKNDYSKNYEDVNYLLKYYTGHQCPDISEYESKLKEDFEKLLDAFDKLVKHKKIETRTSFLNAHYILYQLLTRHGYKCNFNDFNLLKPEKLRQHDEIYFQLCEIVGFDFIPII